MTEENLLQEEEVQETTPQTESESSDASEDLESLFADEPKESQEEDPQAKIKGLEDKIARIEKGVSKFFSQKGREAKSEPKVEIPMTSSVIKNLYFKANPEAQEIWSEVEKTAKQVGKDPFDLYESSAYFKGEAKLRAEAKKADEENKAKISKPSSGTGPKAVDITAVKPEDVASLTPAQKMEWVRHQANKERMSSD